MGDWEGREEERTCLVVDDLSIESDRSADFADPVVLGRAQSQATVAGAVGHLALVLVK